jgi:hypothetical protein
MANFPQPQSAPRNARSWVMLLAGAVIALLGGIALWTAIDTTLHSAPATAKVISTEGGIGRKHTVYAQVEIVGPGQKVVRTEVEDTLGIGTWTEGSTVNLVCTRLRTGSPHCELDSLLDRWLFPVIFFAIGCLAVWGSLRRSKT